MPHNSKVSILMNCHNGEKFLPNALESIQRQSYLNYEVIFVDNLSTDQSINIAKKYGKKIKIVSTDKCLALGGAREYGLKWCDGDYICFLDTDDIWFPNKLSIQVKIMENFPEALLTYSGYTIIDENNNVKASRRPSFKYGNLFGNNLAQYEINFQTVMLRKRALELVDPPYFNPKLQYSPDYNLFMRILAQGSAVSIDKKTVLYRVHSKSLSSSMIDRKWIEAEYTYNDLMSLGCLNKLVSDQQRKKALAKTNYYKSNFFMLSGDYKIARKYLKKYQYTSLKYYLLSKFSYFPFIWFFIHKYYKRY